MRHMPIHFTKIPSLAAGETDQSNLQKTLIPVGLRNKKLSIVASLHTFVILILSLKRNLTAFFHTNNKCI